MTILVRFTLFFYKTDFLQRSTTGSLGTDKMSRAPCSSEGCYEWAPVKKEKEITIQNASYKEVLFRMYIKVNHSKQN